MIRALAAAMVLWAGEAAAEECRLALVLALDVSMSVDATEERIQREGLARALVAPEVVRAVEEEGPIALHAFEWSGPRSQEPLWVGWLRVEGPADLLAVSQAIRAAPRSNRSDDFTAVGAALAYAATALANGPACARRVVDLSGDGENNDGLAPATVYAQGALQGVTVNGLMVGGGFDAPRIERWFRDEVRRGPGAFVIVADGYGDIERAMTAKLVREIDTRVVSKGAR